VESHTHWQDDGFGVTVNREMAGLECAWKVIELEDARGKLKGRRAFKGGRDFKERRDFIFIRCWR
jgi:hypothetical protein